MAITRAAAEQILVERNGPLMTAAGMTVTYAGANSSLNDTLGRTLYYLEHSVTNILSISDVDMAQVTNAEINEFLDVAEFYVLETILGNLDDVDINAGPRSEKLSQLVTQVESKLERLSRRLSTLYGFGESLLSARVISLSFADHNDD